MKKILVTLLVLSCTAQMSMCAQYRVKTKIKPLQVKPVVKEVPINNKTEAPVKINVQADDVYAMGNGQLQKRLNEVGYRVLNANGIESRTGFFIADVNKKRKAPKVSINSFKKFVFVDTGVFGVLDSDDELAALVSQQIAYSNDYSKGLFKHTAMSFSPRKYEKKTDKRAVDYMVNAGYNPVALIIAMNKMSGDPNWYAPYFVHHKGSDRMMYIYQYIYQKYPAYLVENDFLTNVYYQNFLLSSKKERAKIRKIQEEKRRLNKEKINNNKDKEKA